MNILLYAGAAPWRDLVLSYSVPIITHTATKLTLVAAEDEQAAALLRNATERLDLPPRVEVVQQIIPGDVQQAVLAAAEQQRYDLAILGRLNRPLGRLLPGPRSKAITRRLKMSVLRVHGESRPIRRILLASGGNIYTFDNARLTAAIAAPLGAEVTLVHVLSQEQLCFELIPDAQTAHEEFRYSDMMEASVLQEAVDLLCNLRVPTRLQVRVGPVLDEILAELATGNYDMLVVGAHRADDALERILLEDITSALLDHSPLPVLVVKNNHR
ncbi:MAG: universal stress protein [Chloroflexaceae bacterium]|nr:universal stress protein [Chloroflexaceae bacterium]NJO07285.1 universal stress protein [Chloroflexaceae bacterium]